MNAIAHIGYEGFWLINPRILVFLTCNGVRYTYGCLCCTEEEMCDFIRMRAAELLGTGQFDDQLRDVSAEVQCDGATWNLRYDSDEFKFVII